MILRSRENDFIERGFLKKHSYLIIMGMIFLFFFKLI